MIMVPILVDTGPLVALLSNSQQHHKLCRETFSTLRPPLFTCWPVLTEAAYLLREHPSKVRSLLSSTANGFLEILNLSQADVMSINAILKKYEDQSFQLADAALMHLATREGISNVFTLDNRDFSVYRTPEGKQLQILPQIVG